jgi:hypothetical protein
MRPRDAGVESRSVGPLQVGELHAGAGRRSLEFSLRARPDAIIDLAGPLQTAGHSLSHRRAPLQPCSSSFSPPALSCHCFVRSDFLPLTSSDCSLGMHS